MSENYEQMEIDVRLESEKSLKDNVAKVIQFTFDKRNMEAIGMAADMNRILNDLYYGVSARKTPLEEYAEANSEEGFEEAEATEGTEATEEFEDAGQNEAEGMDEEPECGDVEPDAAGEEVE